MFRKLGLLTALLISPTLRAESGHDAWLRYAALDDIAAGQYRTVLPATISILSDDRLEQSAQQEFVRGVRGMVGRTLRVDARAQVPNDSAVVLGTLDEFRRVAPQFGISGNLGPDGYWIKTARVSRVRYILVIGANDRGALYGASLTCTGSTPARQ